jgi:hypothetical protein
MTQARRRTWLAGALVLAACGPSTRDAANDAVGAGWRFGPNRFGPITAHTKEVDLRREFGDSAVTSARIELGEGETTPGTVLFPTDSLRRAEVIWRDTVNLQGPTRIVLRGNRSLWQASRGVSLGTTLKELERLNGRPFTLAGFGWDYAGVIIDWKGGALDSALTGIKLYLNPVPEQHQSTAYAQVLGDRDYSSSAAAMQQLDPKVTQIFVDFESNADPLD